MQQLIKPAGAQGQLALAAIRIMMVVPKETLVMALAPVWPDQTKQELARIAMMV
jgi:hypothetical protein